MEKKFYLNSLYNSLIFSLTRIDLISILCLFPVFFIFGNWAATSVLVFFFFYFFSFEVLTFGKEIRIIGLLPLLIILLAGLNALFNAPTLDLGIKYFVGTVLVPIMLFVVLTNIRISFETLQRFINLNILSCTVLGLFSLYIIITLGAVNFRISSLWNDFNILAAYFMIAFFFTITFIIYSENRKTMIIYLVALIPILLGIFFTQTRGVWLSVVIAIAYYVLRRPKAFIPVGIFFSIIVTVFYSIILDRFLSVKNFGKDWSAIGRIQAWLASIVIIKNNTFFGIGFDSFRFVRDNIFDFYIVEVVHSHNTYLRLWVEMGLIGFLPYIGFFFTAMYFTFRLKSKFKADKRYLRIIDAMQLSFIGLTISFMFEPYFSLYGNSTIIIWMLIAIAFNLYKVSATPVFKSSK